ncbi:hypothetical protein [Methanolobus sp. WCC4]|uniref:hypothetical protein n=1 Tax=Methanolobus sp. WCC4 TaxID=3125784 RepID=UPI0030F7274A
MKTETDHISDSDKAIHDTDIVSKIDVESGSIDISDDWDYYETVFIDSDKLNVSSGEGNINLTLMDNNIDIIIQTSGKRPGGVGYKGFADGDPEYNVDITIREEEVYASVTTYDWMYNIVPTNVVVDGKIVHLVTGYDILDTRTIEENYPVDPLTFEIINEDKVEHDFAIEVYDPYHDLIFNESYSLQPGETIQSPEISKEPGMHRYVYTLDNNETFTENARVERLAELGSSQRVSFIFIDDPEHQMMISIEQA